MNPCNASRWLPFHHRHAARQLAAAVTVCVSTATLHAQPVCPSSGISATAFRRVLNNQFAGLVGARNAATPGTYGAYDFKDGTVAFSGSLVSPTGSVLTMKFSGSGENGVLPVINDRVVNSTFGGELRWQNMAAIGRRLRYDAESCGRYTAAVAAAASRREQALAALSFAARRARSAVAAAVQEREALDRVRLIEQLHTSADSIERQLSPATRASDATWARARAAELRARADSVQVDVSAARAQPTQAALVPLTVPVAELAVSNEFIATVQRAENELLVTGFDFHWWTFAVGLHNNSFKHFSATRPFDQQIRKQQFLSEEASVQVSFLNANATGSRALRMLTFGVAGARADNFADLAPITLTEVSQYGATPDQRSSTKTTKAMTGDYATGLWAGRVYSDFYRFFRRNNTLGVHVFPEWMLLESQRGHVNLGVGIVALVRNPKDNAGRLNVEPYWLLTDVAYRQNSIRSVVGASQFGFRFTLPLTFQPPE